MEMTGQCVGRPCSVMERESPNSPKLAPSPSLPEPEFAPSPSLPKPEDGRADTGYRPAPLIPTEEDLVSEEAVWTLYHRWCLHHCEKRTAEEMKERFCCFQESVHRVLEQNRKYYPGCTYSLAVYSDQTEEEADALFGGDSDSDEEA